jgi:3-phosphoglycerate kinase
MAYTFLRALGIDTGDSLVEAGQIETAASLMEQAAARGITLLLPSDHRIRAATEGATEVRTTDGAAIPSGWRGLDVGPKTIDAFTRALGDARTTLWNGPMGLFEEPPFDQGTRAVARAIAASGAHSVVGGGDSASAVRKFGLADAFTHVSTGGGATLEYLSGMTLPGVEALSNA